VNTTISDAVNHNLGDRSDRCDRGFCVWKSLREKHGGVIWKPNHPEVCSSQSRTREDREPVTFDTSVTETQVFTTRVGRNPPKPSEASTPAEVRIL